MKDFKSFLPADILLPKNGFEKWAVIACDQFTSEPEYWEETARITAGEPSALNIILPEVYLEKDNTKRIDKINHTMEDYLSGGVFEEYKNTYVYTERTVTGGAVRRGIVGLIDLEDYSYEKGAKSLIRATEETVIERIPPRVEIRRGASLELPHIMLLIDDPEGTVIEPLAARCGEFEKLYDFELMQNGGHIKGWRLDCTAAGAVNDALAGLISGSDDRLLFAVGDGNHSLAAAKECYRLNKNGKSRYALVEAVNIHDLSLEFEPIYRVMFGVSPQEVIDGFLASRGGEYFGADAQKFTCIYAGGEREISVKPSGKLCVATLQAYIDCYLKQNREAQVDYIHGEESVRSLCKRENAVGFIFKGMEKSELFDAIRQDGSLPRKTFSMGHANDKRYYLECRSLK